MNSFGRVQPDCKQTYYLRRTSDKLWPLSPHNGTKTFLSDTESVPITIDTGCELTDTLQTWRLAAVSGDTKSGGGTCQEFVRQREYLMMSKAQSSNQKSFKLYTSQRKETTSRLVPAPRLDRLIGSTSYI
ncbi:Hypothetical protein SMAX5B_001891 [Scophthalmus maximus]|uniref:Uncharacterized protein n=1 Tax=Scophthalmus maximus TaxID=52904 RepID=A0A2U9CZB9_SCOMX|nr:Hypothetical protein SMAX5B_001891 [Scophthalmus maximus]